MVHHISRRGFLGLTVGAAAWACGRGNDTAAPVDPTPSTETFSLTAANPPGSLAVGDRRMAFGIFDGPSPFVPDRPGDVRITLAPPSGSAPGTLTPRIEEIRIGEGGDPDHEHEEGTEIHELLVVQHQLEVPGFWSAEAEFEADGETRRLTHTFEVADSSASPEPIAGDEAISTASPTTGDPMGTDPLCTREPPCPLHEVSIDEALTAGKPAVIVFATPAFCTSRTCGPVVDITEVVARDFADEVTFVHVEVWKNGESVGQYPDGAVDAFVAWQLQTEPWAFFVGADGLVRDRWAGAWGQDETRAHVQSLAAGEL